MSVFIYSRFVILLSPRDCSWQRHCSDQLQEQRIVGTEWQMERGDWWLSAVGALREHGGTASTAVFTLCCPEAMKCDQQVRRDMSGHLTQEARRLCGNTRSLVWTGISRITTILVVNTLQVCLRFKNHYLWLTVHEFHEYASSENQKHS